MITQEMLDNWFTYHPPTGQDQIDVYAELRSAGKLLAETIIALTPPGDGQKAAVFMVRSAIWTANAAIACD